MQSMWMPWRAHRVGRSTVHVGMSCLTVLAAACLRPSTTDTPAASAPPPATKASTNPPEVEPIDERPTPAIEAIALGTGTEYRFKGMALDLAAGTAYLASWDRQQLVAVDLADRSRHVIPTPYDGRLNAMGVYLRDGRLYAVMNEIDDTPGHHPLSVLLVIDPAGGGVLHAYELRGGKKGRHHFNHVVVDAQGHAYVSDTLLGRIYAVDTRDAAATPTLLIEHDDLAWVHGLDLSSDARRLFATSYQAGIVSVDLDTQQLSGLGAPHTKGDDGLRYHEGSLYAVGRNAIRRYRLDEAEGAIVETEILLEGHELFNDPRDLHIEGGRLYCLANIELDPVEFPGASRRAPLEDTHVVVLELASRRGR